MQPRRPTPNAYRPTPTAAVVFDVQRLAVHDGPGLRTVVFLKGCPLRCLWCHNPESQQARPEVFFNPALCLECHDRCVPACPHGAIRPSAARQEFAAAGVILSGAKNPSPGAEGHGSFAALRTTAAEALLPMGTSPFARVARELCQGEGRCADACPTEALRLAGRRMTAEQALAEVERDRPFFDASGGGLTVSGGEPAWPGHGTFVRDLLRLARSRGISTWVETCGAAPWRVYQSWLPFLDGVLFDLKLMDPARHRQATGAGNALIHRNVMRLATAPGLRLHVRVPLIPGHNDTPEELERLAAFVRALPGPPPVEVLPYHTYGVNKYRLLGRPYLLDGLAPDAAGATRAHQILATGGVPVLRP